MVEGTIARVESVDLSVADRVGVEAVLVDLAAVVGWVETRRAQCARRLEKLAETQPILPEQIISATGHGSGREAMRTVERAATLSLVPQLEAALEQGAVSTAHVDAVTRALGRLEPAERLALLARGDELRDKAQRLSPEQFEASVKQVARQLERDGGVARFERQRRSTTFRSWTDEFTGMWCAHLELDPESGLTFSKRLEREVDRLFHAAVPDTCPQDERKQGHLRALALLAIVNGDRVATSVAGGSFDVGVVIDLQTLSQGLHERSIIDTGSGLELPIDTIRRMACTAGIIPIVMNGSGVALDVGRTQRLATPAQRAALRAMYPTCAIPWCTARFEHTVPHHLDPWKPSGDTDLGNLGHFKYAPAAWLGEVA